METYLYHPKGVCSKQMEFQMDQETIKSLRVIGGCSGNLQGICKLLEGKQIDDVLPALSGIKCGTKPTSCPDQIAKALIAYRDSKKETVKQ